jgi:hypothetical protein
MSEPVHPKLSALYPADDQGSIRSALVSTGSYDYPDGKTRVKATLQRNGDDYDVVALAAISRDPGLSQDLIDSIQDFTPGADRPQAEKVKQFYQIYKTEGAISNAIRKVSTILGAGGRWEVRKAKKGRYTKAKEELQIILDWVVRNVNGSPLDGVVTAQRGMQAIIHQGSRMMQIEGSWVARQVWSKVNVGDIGKFSVPVNLISVSTAQLEPVQELLNTGIQAFYWKPESSLLQQILNPTKKEVKDYIKRYVPKEYLPMLKRDQKVLLDPALLIHIKNRGLDTQAFGTSFIEPALQAIAFKRSIEALDQVIINSLINRLTIVQVGSSDPNSPYSEPTVAAQRTALMTSLLQDPAPNSLIVWNGDDVKIADVGAYQQVLELDGRHKVAHQKLRETIGVPLALLTGESGDSGSRAAGWAASMGIAAEVDESRNSIGVALEQLGERIAFENGYKPGEIEIAWVWNNSLLQDLNTEYTNLRNDYQAGAISIRTYLKGRGLDPDAEYVQRCIEAGIEPGASVPWVDVFKPVMGMPGQTTDGGKSPGRPTDDQAGKPPAPSVERPGQPNNPAA